MVSELEINMSSGSSSKFGFRPIISRYKNVLWATYYRIRTIIIRFQVKKK